jgi:hypothetical protein
MPLSYSEILDKLDKISPWYASRSFEDKGLILIYLPLERCCIQIFPSTNSCAGTGELRITGLMAPDLFDLNDIQMRKPLDDNSRMYWESISPDVSACDLRRIIERVKKIQAQRNKGYLQGIFDHMR